jgi:CrcB protein
LLDVLLVGSGGFLGANARYLLAKAIAERYGTAFPYGTLLINVTGSLIIGVLLTYLTDRANISPNYRLLFVVGFLGAYTTFSTYTYDTLTLIQDNDWPRALLYLGSTIILGMAAVTVGMWIGRAA